MNINIKGTGIELTDAIRDYVHDKLEAVKKVLRDPEAAFVYVEVGKESQHHSKGEVFKAEFEVKDGGKSYYSVVVAEDLYAAIDEVKDQIVEEIKSKKDKEHSRIRRGGRQIKDFIKGFWKK